MTRKVNPVDVRKAVLRRNAAFKKMTPQQRRVAIAEDALNILTLGNITAMTGGYVKPMGDLYGDAQALLLKGSEYTVCNVCAKGALFLGDVLNRNKVKAEDLGKWDDGEDIICRLSRGNQKSFTRNQLDLIEAAFEGFYIDTDETDEYGNLISRMIDQYIDVLEHPKARLSNILENIIRNKGTFIEEPAEVLQKWLNDRNFTSKKIGQTCKV